MRAQRALLCGLLVVLAATLPVAAVAPQGGIGAVGDGARVSPAPSAESTVHLDVQLQASGDATWTVTTFVPLDDATETDSFRDLGRQYVNGTTDAGPDVDQFRRYVAAARSASDRPMGIPDETVEREWAIEDGTGILRLQFTWMNFAREDGDEYVVDDAFRTNSGTWLSQLERGQVLVVRPPEGVGFIETPRAKGVTNATLRWEGPQTFEPDYFHIVYQAEPVGTTPPTVTTSPGTPTTSNTPTSTLLGETPSETYLLFVVLFGGAAAYFWGRRNLASQDEPGAGPGGGAPVGGTVTDRSDAVTDGSAAPDGEAATGGGATAGGETAAGGPAEPTPEEPFAGVDVEMLSDEERVLRLLDANGGRMKQARIVKETDWSNAKVSQLLSGMADEGEIDKLRIGRENLISLPDVDVDSFEE